MHAAVHRLVVVVEVERVVLSWLWSSCLWRGHEDRAERVACAAWRRITSTLIVELRVWQVMNAVHSAELPQEHPSRAVEVQPLARLAAAPAFAVEADNDVARCTHRNVRRTGKMATALPRRITDGAASVEGSVGLSHALVAEYGAVRGLHRDVACRHVPTATRHRRPRPLTGRHVARRRRVCRIRVPFCRAQVKARLQQQQFVEEQVIVATREMRVSTERVDKS